MKAFLSHHSCLLQEAMSPRIEFCWTNNEDSALDRIAQSWAIWQTFSELLAILQNSLYTKNVQKRKSAAENFKDISWIQTQLATFFPQFSTSFRKTKTLLAAFPQTFIPKRYRSGCFHKGGIQPIPRLGLGIQKRNLNCMVNGELSPESTPSRMQSWPQFTSHFSHHSTVKSIWSMCILDLHPPPRMLAGHHQKSETFWGSRITTTKLKRKSATITEWGGG